MRVWTLVFFVVTAFVILVVTMLGADSALQFAARLLFLFAVLAALFAALRSATLQMADGAALPAGCPRERTPVGGGRRRSDPAPQVAGMHREAPTAPGRGSGPRLGNGASRP